MNPSQDSTRQTGETEKHQPVVASDSVTLGLQQSSGKHAAWAREQLNDQKTLAAEVKFDWGDDDPRLVYRALHADSEDGGIYSVERGDICIRKTGPPLCRLFESRTFTEFEHAHEFYTTIKLVLYREEMT